MGSGKVGEVGCAGGHSAGGVYGGLVHEAFDGVDVAASFIRR